MELMDNGQGHQHSVQVWIKCGRVCIGHRGISLRFVLIHKPHSPETCTVSNLTAVSEDVAYTIPNKIRPGVVATSPRCREGYHVTVSAVCQDDRTWRVEEQCVQSE